ncbi:hypothetical protein ROZALSC1DRAFT_21597 [Rozella allomycis CSF55]|uniref:Uncharacterized protein n=1 Tax=Rozella allomycis (strain CSF55) TaxID=988480 RepID=A0A4P9YL56_ROZAC|nr:hypothetical protein ROZALSC1DRAFT_21597 [Rozella allomycis CSF55]
MFLWTQSYSGDFLSRFVDAEALRSNYSIFVLSFILKSEFIFDTVVILAVKYGSSIIFTAALQRQSDTIVENVYCLLTPGLLNLLPYSWSVYDIIKHYIKVYCGNWVIMLLWELGDYVTRAVLIFHIGEYSLIFRKGYMNCSICMLQP